MISSFYDEDQSDWGTSSKITESIFQGDAMSSSNKKDLERKKITHILAAGRSLTKHFPNDYKYFCVDADDSENENMFPHFEKAYEFIDECISNGGKILIHCFAGVSRSSTFTCVYLIKKEKITYDKAIEIIREGRPFAEPNIGFQKQLNLWYKREVLNEDISSDLKKLKKFSYDGSNFEDDGSNFEEILNNFD